jgi:hypothetical protein
MNFKQLIITTACALSVLPAVAQTDSLKIGFITKAPKVGE